MVQQFEQATCFSLTRNWDSFGRGLPQSQQRRVSIEMILAVIRILDYLDASESAWVAFASSINTKHKSPPFWQRCRKGGPLALTQCAA